MDLFNVFLISFISLIVGLFLRDLFEFVKMVSLCRVLSKKIRDQVLLLLSVSSQRMEIIDHLLYDQISQAGAFELAMSMKDLDKVDFDKWKIETIKQIKEYYPREYERDLNFSTWQEAMSEVEKIYKKRLKQD